MPAEIEGFHTTDVSGLMCLKLPRGSSGALLKLHPGQPLLCRERLQSFPSPLMCRGSLTSSRPTSREISSGILNADLTFFILTPFAPLSALSFLYDVQIQRGLILGDENHTKKAPLLTLYIYI